MEFSKNIFVSLVLFFLTVGVTFAQFKNDTYQEFFDSETTTSFKKHINQLTSFDGRKAGSLGEKSAAEYLFKQLEEYGVEMLCPSLGDKFGIQQEAGDTLISRNVYGFVQGYDPKLRNQYIVVGARLDNLGKNIITIDGKEVEQVYYGANGNASGLSTMLELARMVSTNSILFRRSIIFIGFGASCYSYAGAWYFLNRSFSDYLNIDAMINLDMLGLGSTGFYAYTASNNDMNDIVNRLANELYPLYPELITYEPYPSDNRAFYSKEIPSVYFTTGKYAEHNSPRDKESIIDYESLERQLEYIYNYTLALANENEPPAFRSESLVKRDPSFDDVVSYHDCDLKPAFLNNTDPRVFMQKWVYQYLKYPKEAISEGIQGRVMVDFIIEKDGKLTHPRIVRSVDPLLDAEAIRVVEASPKWKPGRVKGAKVRAAMTITVEFRLAKSGNSKNLVIKK